MPNNYLLVPFTGWRDNKQTPVEIAVETAFHSVIFLKPVCLPLTGCFSQWISVIEVLYLTFKICDKHFEKSKNDFRTSHAPI